MSRFWSLPCLVLCSCVSSMVPPPREILRDGVVECTDTMETPIAALVVAVVSTAVLIYGLNDLGNAIENGGLGWLPVLSFVSPTASIAAMEGAASVLDCREAKQRGAEVALRLAAIERDKEAKALARSDAGALWKTAATAARNDDCTTVRELDPRIRELDIEFHAVVFARDVAIARCLATP